MEKLMTRISFIIVCIPIEKWLTQQKRKQHTNWIRRRQLSIIKYLKRKTQHERPKQVDKKKTKNVERLTRPVQVNGLVVRCAYYYFRPSTNKQPNHPFSWPNQFNYFIDSFLFYFVFIAFFAEFFVHLLFLLILLRTSLCVVHKEWANNRTNK